MKRKRKSKVVPLPGSKYGTRTKRLSVKVTVPIDRALRRQARANDVTVSDVIVTVLERGLGLTGDGVFE